MSIAEFEANGYLPVIIQYVHCHDLYTGVRTKLKSATRKLMQTEKNHAHLKASARI